MPSSHKKNHKKDKSQGVPQPPIKEFSSAHHREIYPGQNQLNRGYAVQTPKVDPAKRNGNGRFVNQLGEKITFYIEQIEANFEMAGQTAQSRSLRQFFPHNMVQPSIMVTGIAPNSYQYNRLADFVRVSHVLSLRGRGLRDQNKPFRNFLDAQGRTVMIPTIRFDISNGTEFKLRNGRTIKGIHKPWKLEGYVRSMTAGAEHFQQAPPFQFEFVIAESLSKPAYPNFGIWNDFAVTGDQIRSWMEIFKSHGKKGFVPQQAPGEHAANLAAQAINVLNWTPPTF
jgi:hypothetical protein